MLTIDYNSYRTTTPYGKRVRFLVLHYTALDFAASVKALTTGAASAHYLIPAPHDPSYKAAGFKGQRIFNLVAEEDRAWHAGVSGWARRDNLNDTSIGIEIVNLARDDDGVFTFPDYERSQINALKQLAKNILQRYPDMTPKNVVGHSDIAVGRKSDPGPKLPWKELYEPVSAPGTTTPPAIAIAKASSATACRRAPTCWRRSACTAMRCRRRSTMPTSPACCALSRCISARRTTTARWMWRRRRSSTL